MNPSPSTSKVVPLFALEGRDDDALMALSRTRREAFDVLVGRHQQALLRIAAKYLGDVATARDACQATFLEVYRARHAYRPLGRFPFFLRRVLLNQCHLVARRGGADARLAALDVAPDAPPPPDALILAEERRQLVEAEVSKLSEKLRAVIVLRYAGGHTLEDIAEVLDVPVGTVKSRLFAAMQALASALPGEAP
ncbi:MAG: sigma-70 family RNA polymerase sigma factor [Myxococcaceae bacterium]|nr:sigma-70 family RNA polymerase sigma factor [Myxococcaceae bacterium]